MEKLVSVKQEYASLDKIEAFVKQESSFEVKQQYDHWEMRTDVNGQMEKCLVVKKSNMHGVKLYFTKENMLKINYVIPNKVMNSFFGSNQQKYKSIKDIVAGKIKDAVLSGSQKKAFEELVEPFNKIAI